MKSSLLTLTITSALVLGGCFKSAHEGCSSCSDETSEMVGCPTCPSDVMMPESTVIMEEEGTEKMPMTEEIIVDEEDEK